MNIKTCTSHPDDLLESHRPPNNDARWSLVISGFWSDDRYHGGHVAYQLAKTAPNTWILDAVARNAELDGVTEEDVETGRLNDDQIQALWRTTLAEAQARRYRRIVAVCTDAPADTNDRTMAHALYLAVKKAGGRVVDDPDDDWEDAFGIRKLWSRAMGNRRRLRSDW